MQSFREFYNAGAYLNTGFAGLDNQFFGIGKSLNLSTPTLEIPTKTLSGKIRSIFYTKNPITIVFENGGVWKLNMEQWRYLQSVGKEPREGKQVMLELFLDGTIKSVSLT